MVAVALDTTSALVEGVVAVDAVGGVRWNRFHCLILRKRLHLRQWKSTPTARTWSRSKMSNVMTASEGVMVLSKAPSTLARNNVTPIPSQVMTASEGVMVLSCNKLTALVILCTQRG